jgi:hypothetical protein
MYIFKQFIFKSLDKPYNMLPLIVSDYSLRALLVIMV